MRSRNKFLVGAAMFFLGAALSGEYERVKEYEIGVRGRIVSIEEDDDKLKIYVEGIQYEDTYLEKAIVYVDGSTIIAKKFTDDLLTMKDLNETSFVEVIFENLIKDNELMEFKAKKLVLI